MVYQIKKFMMTINKQAGLFILIGPKKRSSGQIIMPAVMIFIDKNPQNAQS